MRQFAVCLVVLAAAFAQQGEIQKPKGTWQKPGEIQVPKGTWQKPGEIQKTGEIQAPKGIQAIKVQDQGCKKRLTVESDTLFEFDKATLSPEAEETLMALGPLVQKAGRSVVRIEGHTDAIGSPAYNQTLSQKRAQTVKNWLVSHAYVNSGTPVEGCGKTRPVAPNTNPDGSDNPTGRQQNRRVEVIVDSCG